MIGQPARIDGRNTARSLFVSSHYGSLDASSFLIANRADRVDSVSWVVLKGRKKIDAGEIIN